MLILISLSRLSFRLLDEGIRKGNQKGKPTLVYGAGVGGQMAMKEIETNRDLGMTIVGFIDDNSRIHGRKIQGYQVLGGQEGLENIIKKHNIQEIIVSFKQNGKEKKREVNNLCRNIEADVNVTQMRLVIN
jgi:FlaA1/EpsC-like NDP-sugar epimerase